MRVAAVGARPGVSDARECGVKVHRQKIYRLYLLHRLLPLNPCCPVCKPCRFSNTTHPAAVFTEGFTGLISPPPPPPPPSGQNVFHHGSSASSEKRLGTPTVNLRICAVGFTGQDFCTEVVSRCTIVVAVCASPNSSRSHASRLVTVAMVHSGHSTTLNRFLGGVVCNPDCQAVAVICSDEPSGQIRCSCSLPKKRSW